MRFLETPVAGAWVIEPEPVRDERGSFARLYCREEFARHGLAATVAQVNAGFSPRAGTLRGLHYQVAPHLEAKLVSCTRGRAFDVVVDLRSGTPGFGRWHGEELDPGNGRMLYVPEGCGHGYLTLEPDTEVRYQASTPFVPAAGRGVRWDDPRLAIEWPRPVLVISARDAAWPLLDGEPA